MQDDNYLNAKNVISVRSLGDNARNALSELAELMDKTPRLITNPGLKNEKKKSFPLNSPHLLLYCISISIYLFITFILYIYNNLRREKFHFFFSKRKKKSKTEIS